MFRLEIAGIMSVVRSRDFAAVARREEVDYLACGAASEAAERAVDFSFSSEPAPRSDDPSSSGYGGALAHLRRPIAAISRPNAVGRMLPLGGSLKRVLDVAIASIVLVLLSPLLLLVSVLVKLNMGGDVIYRHRRVGFGGREFDCLKFRTMVANGDDVLARHLEQNPDAAREWRETRKLTKDPRITRLGHFLRKTSLDELPQFVNIILGDMSCVGPRPIVTAELEMYGTHVVDYLVARPGITGPWQVSGRSSVGYAERVLLDANYVKSWSMLADFVILLRTIPAVLRVQNAA